MSARTHQQVTATAEPAAPPQPLDVRLRVHQLGLSAAAIRDIALITPMWALVMTVMLGGPISEIGNTPQRLTWPWVVLCASVAAATFVLWRYIDTH